MSLQRSLDKNFFSRFFLSPRMRSRRHLYNVAGVYGDFCRRAYTAQLKRVNRAITRDLFV